MTDRAARVVARLTENHATLAKASEDMATAIANKDYVAARAEWRIINRCNDAIATSLVAIEHYTQLGEM